MKRFRKAVFAGRLPYSGAATAAKAMTLKRHRAMWDGPHAAIMVTLRQQEVSQLALEFAIPIAAKTSEVLGFGRCREGEGYLTTHGFRLRSAADRSRGVRDQPEHRSLNAVCGEMIIG
jgi:hypothetical protein